ncbi:MAG TPA: hypothetical protein VKR54_04080 [Candidatus Babeliales bacterium]|jgi:hypothetical protein|nr:hypothetical protein [Candidatus Babeliales bacterium]
MKKSTIILGLLALGANQIHSMEQQNILNKDQQKEFRATLAGYRGAYVLQRLLEATGGKEVKAETRLRQDYVGLLDDYKRLHGNDPYVAKKFKRLESFKNEEVPARFEQLKKL